MATVIRSAYGEHRPIRSGVVCQDKAARQEFKDECDINRIMKKYRSTGVLPQRPGGMFGDFSEVGDFLEAQNFVRLASERFASLPSDVRKRFDNDPGLLLQFIQDKANREEAVKLGLIEVKSAAPKAESNPGPDVKPGDSK